MSILDHQDDLDLLLSLQDRVLETPPTSPSPHSPGYLSDNGSPKQKEKADMSVFKDAVQDCLECEPKAEDKPVKLKPSGNPNDADVEKYSGLRIRNQLVSSTEIKERFSDIRFVRLSAIKNLLIGDTFSGCWATVGVLTEKGTPKTSSTGKSYCIWKIGCLDENTISLFLFGDAYQMNLQEKAGTVFALFNCAMRKDTVGNSFSLSVYSPGQMLKMGTSVDYGVCKGRRKDGMACTLVINKRQGIYCKYHKSKASEKYSSMRTELQGGNLRTAFRPRDYLKSEGIYLVDPLAEKTNLKSQPVKLLSVDSLRKALSNAGKVTTNVHSQGIRFLSEVAGKTDPKPINKRSLKPNEKNIPTDKRKSSSMNVRDSAVIRSRCLDAKKMKTERVLADETPKVTRKMIELDVFSSDEDI